MSRAVSMLWVMPLLPCRPVGAEQRLIGDQRREMDDDVGKGRGIRREAGAQRRRCRAAGPAARSAASSGGEFGLAAALMGERQEIDHQPAGRLFWDLFEQPVEGLAIGVAREELVAVDEIEQRHGFAPQGVDHMAIIDDMGVLACGDRRARASGSSAGCRRRTDRGGHRRAGPAGDGR